MASDWTPPAVKKVVCVVHEPWQGSGGGEGAPFAGSERSLNQDEIDSLLGFDLSDDESAEPDWLQEQSSAQNSRRAAESDRQKRLFRMLFFAACAMLLLKALL